MPSEHKRWGRPRGEKAVARALGKIARRRGKEEIRDVLHLLWLDRELSSALEGSAFSRKRSWFGLQHLEEIVTRQELCAEINNAAEERASWDSLGLDNDEPLSYIDILLYNAKWDPFDNIDDSWDDIDDGGADAPSPWNDEPSPMSAEWKQTWLNGAYTRYDNDGSYYDNDDSCYHDDYWDWEWEEDLFTRKMEEDQDLRRFSGLSDAAAARNVERALAGERYFKTAHRTVRKYGSQRKGTADSLKKPSLANTSRKAIRRELSTSHAKASNTTEAARLDTRTEQPT